MGNHYLNVFSTHSGIKNNARLYTMREDATKSLKLYILYSALTGKGQLRDEKGAADILAIFDKASNADKTGFRRIRLYDMSDLIIKIAETNFTQGVQFSPNIND